jgi:hypothetical protein
MRHAARIALAVLAAVACTRTRASPDPAPSAPTAIAATDAAVAPFDGAPAPAAAIGADAAAAPPDDDVLPPGMTAWTDPPVLAKLATDCAWEPAASMTAPQDESSTRRTPLSCEFLFEQSCVPAPCLNDQEEKCKPACSKACDACGARCKDACAACKRACTDDACKLACASTCGRCRQACVSEADRCVSGTCNAARVRCEKNLAQLFQKNRAACQKACGPASLCPPKCSELPEAKQAACWATCRERFVAAGCPEVFYATCVMAGTLDN